MSARRPTPREARALPSGCAVSAASLLLGALLAGVVAWALAHDLPTEAQLRAPASAAYEGVAVTVTADGGAIRWYEFADPETGVRYLVNDRGGCVPRLGAGGEGVAGDG